MNWCWWCCGLYSPYSQLDDDTEPLLVKKFNLKRDSLFVEDHQIIEYNFSQLINYKTGKLNFQHDTERGKHIIEVTNKNEEDGILSFSVKLRASQTQHFQLRPMQAIQISYKFDFPTRISISVTPDRSYAIDYTGYIMLNDFEEEEDEDEHEGMLN
eukprot:gene12594-6414_t